MATEGNMLGKRAADRNWSGMVSNVMNNNEL